MKARVAAALVGLSIACPVWAQALSDAQVKQRIIAESLQSYSGNCPCPYNVDRAGRSCGARSAWSRAGGAQPICYDREVGADQVKRYRDTHKT
jgi:hypothetical protein